MSDSVASAIGDEVTATGDSDPRDLGNGSMSVMTGLMADPGHEVWGLADYPWIPALLVGCGMVVFLSLSFYSHHKRVRRKRELLMDYLSILVYSGAWARGRSVSVLCNTNWLALSELGRSFKIKQMRRTKSDSAHYHRKKYLMNLFTIAENNKKATGLKRFVSAPTERKFRAVADHLILMNKAIRFGRCGVGTFARNLSVPDVFDSCEVNVHTSIAEAKTNITQGMLLSSGQKQRESARHKIKLKFSKSVTEPMSKHSYENVAFFEGSSPPKDKSWPTEDRADTSVTFDDLTAQNQRTFQFPCPQTFPPGTSTCQLSVSQLSNDLGNKECHEGNQNDLFPASKNVSVSVTYCSALPFYSQTLSIPFYSPKMIESSSDSMLSSYHTFQTGPVASHQSDTCHSSKWFPLTNMSVVYTSEEDQHQNLNPLCITESSDFHSLKTLTSGAFRDVRSGKPICLQPDANEYEKTISTNQNSFKISKTDRCFHEHPFQPAERHAKSLDEKDRETVSQDRSAVPHTKSLEDIVNKISRKYKVPDRLSCNDSNSPFPEENHPPVGVQSPALCLPAAFICQPLSPSPTVSGQSFLPSFRHKQATTITPPCKQEPKPAKDAYHPKSNGRKQLSKALSTLSTKSLISHNGTPPQSFSSLDSDLKSPASPQRLFSFFDDSNIFSSNTVDGSQLLHTAEDATGESCQQFTIADCPCQKGPPLASNSVRLTPADDSDINASITDFEKKQMETLSPFGSKGEVGQTSDVHRLPRFQLRSDVKRHRNMQTQLGVMQVLDTRAATPDLENDDSLWISSPLDTKI